MNWWIVLNIIVSCYELYGYANRHDLDKNIILKGWKEYAIRADPRYIENHYVWYFELMNVFNTACFIVNYRLALLLQIICTIGYFITFMLDKQIKHRALTVRKIAYLGISSLWIFVPLIQILSVSSV
jgi:hypothetical protein